MFQRFVIISCFALLFGCIESNPRKGRPLVVGINAASQSYTIPQGCQLISLSRFSCPTSIFDQLTPIQRQRLTDLSCDSIQGQIEVVTTCPTRVELIQETNLNQRPNLSVDVSGEPCICLNGKPDSENSGNYCPQFCAQPAIQSISVLRPYLFVNTTPGSAIELNPLFGTPGSTRGWCQNAIDDNNPNPTCLVESFNGYTTLNFSPTFPTDNTFYADVSGLPYNQLYTFKLKVNSGEESKTFTVKREAFVGPTPDSPPLSISSLHLYQCINNAFNPDDEDEVWFSSELYYTYPSHTNPPTIPYVGEEVHPVYCHDYQTQGFRDTPLLPRLNLAMNHLKIWDERDSRFYDLNGNEALDINEQIVQELVNENIAVPANTNFFVGLQWPNFPYATENPLQGMILQSFVDQQSNQVFCPNSTHYNSGERFFEILEEIIETDTEAFYLAKKINDTFVPPNNDPPISSPDAYLLMNQTQLFELGFIYQNQVKVPVTQALANILPVHFYWPLCEGDGCDPLTKQEHQKEFIVKTPQEAFGPAGLGFSFGFSPPDRRLGCIPKE